MTPGDDEAVVRRFFAAWNTGDVDAFDELVNDDFGKLSREWYVYRTVS